MGRCIALPRVNESVTRHHLVVGAGGLLSCVNPNLLADGTRFWVCLS